MFCTIHLGKGALRRTLCTDNSYRPAAWAGWRLVPNAVSAPLQCTRLGPPSKILFLFVPTVHDTVHPHCLTRRSFPACTLSHASDPVPTRVQLFMPLAAAGPAR